MSFNFNDFLTFHFQKRLNTLIFETKEELERYGPKLKDADKQLVLLELIDSFDSDFKLALKGMAKSGELCAGAKICHILSEVLDDKLKTIDPSDGLKKDEMVLVIRNATGLDSSIFVPEVNNINVIRRRCFLYSFNFLLFFLILLGRFPDFGEEAIKSFGATITRVCNISLRRNATNCSKLWIRTTVPSVSKAG